MKPSLLAASTIFVAVKIAKQINSEVYICKYFCRKLSKLSRNSEENILDLAKRILFNAQNFEEKLPKLDNLKKFHYNMIVDYQWRNDFPFFIIVYLNSFYFFQ